MLDLDIQKFKTICSNFARDKGIISQIYSYLNKLHLPQKSSAMVRWETDIGQEFTTKEWSDMILNMHKSTRSMTLKETVLKVYTR